MNSNNDKSWQVKSSTHTHLLCELCSIRQILLQIYFLLEHMDLLYYSGHSDGAQLFSSEHDLIDQFQKHVLSGHITH